MSDKCDKDLHKQILEYIQTTYKVKTETPWMQYPDHMTFKDVWSDKWFALMMPVEKRKLHIDEEGFVYVINLKNDPELIGMIIQSRGYYPAYHMNKRHWISVLLDGTVPPKQIKERIDESFRIVTDSPTRRIYEAVKQIPSGCVATYGQVALLAGDKKMARAVGNALHKNPDPDGIPCYRVVNSKGELAGEFAFGGEGAQAKLLMADGIEVVNGRVDLEKYGVRV